MIATVIPSKNAVNLAACLQALRRAEPDTVVYVIDDGLTIRPPEAIYLEGVKPFVFARNVNIGIHRAVADGAAHVMLLNDDCLVKTPRGLSLLADEANHGGWAAVSASTNVGHRNQRHASELAGQVVEVRHVAYCAILFPVDTFADIGLLDERFTAYGYEDNDYSFRVAQDERKLAVHFGVFVDHSALTPTFRKAANASADVRVGRHQFIDKWKDFRQDYQQWL